MPSISEVESERGALLGLCYRMLGTVADAEDAVQETYVRWLRLSDEERTAIRNPGAWLTRVAGRVCLDMLGSARARRERYVGEWLPEPVPGDSPLAASVPVDPIDRVTLDDSVSMALLVLLESLTPAERVAFVLHDVFAVPFGEIAETVGRSPEAVRQLASQARRPGASLGPIETPDGLGFLATLDGRPSAVFSLRVQDGRITDVYVMRNPDKLTQWGLTTPA
jgi:RNA polymerase sigma-70 factor (ECF subfamily)